MRECAENMVAKAYVPFQKQANCLEDVATDVTKVLERSPAHVQKILKCIGNARCNVELDTVVLNAIIRQFQKQVLYAYVRKMS